eukprot:CAMPEP_0117004972 /NCGR_PEP_ID=MMETSP0472-20121206/5763_1 /TAXON_ID=693140 ORGANISM="Tiarina fusus, Strain LIS" /NCGR_SAMPLE_ID=MMETSP0472 /ASSEMBLY_ACC=CAM_ASM_000603 /LENGTH=240 /DNA_ID=CAMNT_0004706097 /DNA_START=329 /DNA_END=1051 /DNA_ORIENTATION=+
MRNEPKAEQVWYSLLMTAICGQLTGVTQKEITGIVISPRDHLTQIYVWNKHSLNSKYKEIMQSFISDSLDVPKHWLRYNTHKHKVYQNTNPKENKKKGKKKQQKKEEPISSEDEEKEEKEEQELLTDEEDVLQGQEIQEEKISAEDYEEESTHNHEADCTEEIQKTVGETNEDQTELDNEIVDTTENKDSINSESTREIITTKTETLVAEPQPAGVSLFSVSIGFAIFLALLYNLYILFG